MKKESQKTATALAQGRKKASREVQPCLTRSRRILTRGTGTRQLNLETVHSVLKALSLNDTTDESMAFQSSED